MDRTCPVENCSLINRAMKLLYTSIAALDIYIKIGTERSIFIFSLPFLFNKNVRFFTVYSWKIQITFPYEITLNTFEKKTFAGIFERVDISPSNSPLFSNIRIPAYNCLLCNI